MKEGYNLVVTYNGQNTDAYLWADSTDERAMGTEITWYLTINQVPDDNILEFSEYPDGGFTEIKRDPNLATPLNDITAPIVADKNA